MRKGGVVDLEWKRRAAAVSLSVAESGRGRSARLLVYSADERAVRWPGWTGGGAVGGWQKEGKGRGWLETRIRV